MTSLRDVQTHLLLLACALLLALGVRCAAAWKLAKQTPAGSRFEFGDSDTYWELGAAIARGEPYAYGPREYRVMRTPGYPLLLATLQRATGGAAGPWEARMLSIALGLIAVAATYFLGRWIFTPSVGLLAAFLAALSPCAAASSAVVLAEAPFIPVMLAQLACFWGMLTAKTTQQLLLCSALVGLLAGVGALIRPSWLLFTPLVLLAALLLPLKDASPSRRMRIVGAAAAMIALCVAMAPWWIRNYQVSGRWIATTLQAGPSLYDGWRPDADGSSDMRFVEEFEARADQEGVLPRVGINRELALDAQMSAAAKEWAKQHPRRVLELAAIKFLRTWNVAPNYSEMQSPWLRAAVFLGYAPVMVAAALGAWKLRRRSDVLLLCLAPAIYFSLLHMVYVGSIRYRQPAMFPLFLLAAAWLAELSIVQRRLGSTTLATGNREGAA